MRVYLFPTSLMLCGFMLWPFTCRAQDAVAVAPVVNAAAPDLKKLAVDAAVANDLPADYFVKLIHQESGFNTSAVSIAGAQGIAQFMPATARDYGLKDPFDATEALPKSARLLHDLKGEFGNLGLAAAAYNAGPRRVHDWLAGRAYLPSETISYVYAITGRGAEDWAPPGTHLLKGDGGFMGGRTLDARRNWELTLLLSLSKADAPKTLTLVSSLKRDQRSSRANRRMNAEVGLCRSCIVQNFY